MILAQPWLLGLTLRALREEVDRQTHDDQDKRNRIHPVHAQVKYLDADAHAPEVRRQQTDVEEGRAGKAEQHWCKGVKEREDERIPGEVAADGGVPHGGSEARAVEDAHLSAVDEHAPEGHLSHHFIQGALRYEELLDNVAQAVE